MRITLVGINYAPEHAGIAPYTAGLARHLARSHDVTMITGIPHYPGWVCDPDYRRLRTAEDDSGVRVIRLRHFVPAKQDAGRRLLYELTYSLASVLEGMRHKSDVVVAVVPALLSPIAARMIARVHRAPYGVIVQDMMSKAARESGVVGGVRVAELVSRVESKGAGRADGIAVIHGAFARALHEAGVPEDRTTLIRNWTHIQAPSAERAATRARLGWGEEIVALHTGNMGLKQDLGNVVEAARLASAKQSDVRFVLMGEGSQRARLQHVGRDVAALDFAPPVDDADYADVLAAADVLLLNEGVGIAEMSLPSKLTSYFAAGRPVVAATSDHGGTAEVVRESRAGVVIAPGRPELLLDTVFDVGRDRGQAEQMGKAGQRFAEAELSEAAALLAYTRWIEGLVERGHRRR